MEWRKPGGYGTIRPLDRPDPGLERVAKANGFSLHASVSCEGYINIAFILLNTLSILLHLEHTEKLFCQG
ncbi:MAG: hypothetical protein DRQ65_09510 [Gammaproteobacteria bacterium]|nr:MAG: hypothetical protein DRQ65_09510 [Gammaproteobacteria bacterium]